jgi:hypothetical protein
LTTYFCKAKRLLMHKGLSVLGLNESGAYHSRVVAIPPGVCPKHQNKPEKYFRINKSWQKRTRNEPERTREVRAMCRANHLESAERLGMVKGERETNLNELEILSAGRLVSGFVLETHAPLFVRACASTKCRKSKGGRKVDPCLGRNVCHGTGRAELFSDHPW